MGGRGFSSPARSYCGAVGKRKIGEIKEMKIGSQSDIYGLSQTLTLRF
jgi:hypothetical protein